MPIHFELAGLYLARDEDQSAIDIYNRILSLDPRNARAMLRLCLAYRKVGEFSRALGFCEDSVGEQSSGRRSPFSVGACCIIASVYSRKSRDAFEEVPALR